MQGPGFYYPNVPRSTSRVQHPGTDQGPRYISQGLQSGQGVPAGKVRGSGSLGCILWGWVRPPGCGMEQHEEKVLNLLSLPAFNTSSKGPWSSKFKPDLARHLKPSLFRYKDRTVLLRAYQIDLQPVNFVAVGGGRHGTGTPIRDGSRVGQQSAHIKHLGWEQVPPLPVGKDRVLP